MSPLTVAQLLDLSRTFPAGPFSSIRSLLDRLQRLRLGGWVRRWPLAIARRGGGAPDYYKITPSGLRLLYGDEARPPTKQFFAEVAVARHHHMHSLAEFLVHTAVAAHPKGFRMIDVHPENTFVADVAGELLVPDHRFDLVNSEGQRFRYLIELDNSTETIYSAKHEKETWHRKIRLHDAYQDQCDDRHRVVVVTTRSRARLDNILNAAAQLVRNPLRTLFIGTYLLDYLATTDAAFRPCLFDHRHRMVSLLPQFAASLSRSDTSVAPS
ncbi:MAG TPA: replication-relaxation family protein [Pirellulales bacterium]|nr:replication-relaxation family protein [Pirellulales bacterium]